MKTYKVVPYAATLVVEKGDKVQDKIAGYFDVINQECRDGWEFHSMAPVSVTRKQGGIKSVEETYNAFIFVKEIAD